jgi:hypothetical protein
MESRYLNVDCTLRSSESLTALLSFLEKDIFLLWDQTSETTSFVGFENNLVGSNSPEKDILEFLRLFALLPEELLKQLLDCRVKTLDIGFESGDKGDPVNVELNTNIIRKLSEYGFSLKIRIYPIIDND